MGTDRGQEDERPPHRVFVASFDLAVFPVARAEHERFVTATRHDVLKDRGTSRSRGRTCQSSVPAGLTRLTTAWGDQEKKSGRCDCQRKRYGNAPLAAGRRPCSRGAM